MPQFDVTTPDGRTIEVTAPEGATEAQAIAYAKAYDSSITTPNGANTRAGNPPQLQEKVLENIARKSIDLSKLSNADLDALIKGDMTKVSDAGLQILARSASQPKQADSSAIEKTVAVTQAETMPIKPADANLGSVTTGAMFAAVAGLAAGVLLHWVITRHLWRNQRVSAHQTGLWCGSIAASTSLMLGIGQLVNIAVLFKLTDEDWYKFGLQWSLLLPIIYFLIGYAAGWIFRRIKPLAGQAIGASPNVPSAASPGAANEGIVQPKTADEDRIYATIANELENGVPDKGLWTRLFAESGGDENQTKVLYIKERAERLSAVERAQMP